MFSKILTKNSITSFSDETARLREALSGADAVLIGAGSGLSSAAGFLYSGKRFEEHFSDFGKKYGIRDIYSGGFYPFDTLEEYWGWWARHIYWNRYVPIPNDAYQNLLELVKDKDYFVLTTNVDHCFQKAGFDKKRLFYTQGDYGLFQCSRPCCQKNYDNEETVRKMLAAQGYAFGPDETVSVPDGVTLKTAVPSELVPHCPVCGAPMTVNLRCDDTFVQDEGWYLARSRYEDFVRRHRNRNILYLELGVGMNTPVIIKYPFWRMTAENPEAVYACVNDGEAVAPDEIKNRSVCINGDIGAVLKELQTV